MFTLVILSGKYVNKYFNCLVCWDENKNNTLLNEAVGHKILNLSLSKCETRLFALFSDPAISCFDLNERKLLFSHKFKGDAKFVRAVNTEISFVLTNNTLFKFDEKGIVQEKKLDYEASSLEVGNRGVFIGCKVNI